MSEANPQLTEALESLEKRLETPIIPGELMEWTDAVTEAVVEVEKHLVGQIEEAHPKQLAEMREQDEGLAPRVEQLEQADAALRQKLADVGRLARKLRDVAEKIEAEEHRFAEATAALVEKGLDLVIAARKQEAAIATWYMEAFERDRGVVD
jgi:DNA repair exonuclease SbcCD ATPase subunit